MYIVCFREKKKSNGLIMPFRLIKHTVYFFLSGDMLMWATQISAEAYNVYSAFFECMSDNELIVYDLYTSESKVMTLLELVFFVHNMDCFMLKYGIKRLDEGCISLKQTGSRRILCSLTFSNNIVAKTWYERESFKDALAKVTVGGNGNLVWKVDNKGLGLYNKVRLYYNFVGIELSMDYAFIAEDPYDTHKRMTLSLSVSTKTEKGEQISGYTPVDFRYKYMNILDDMYYIDNYIYCFMMVVVKTEYNSELSYDIESGDTKFFLIPIRLGITGERLVSVKVWWGTDKNDSIEGYVFENYYTLMGDIME